MCDDEDFPFFTKETFRRYSERLAATATVKASKALVSLCDEEARAKHITSITAAAARSWPTARLPWPMEPEMEDPDDNLPIVSPPILLNDK
jgi:hypothetical protein